MDARILASVKFVYVRCAALWPVLTGRRPDTAVEGDIFQLPALLAPYLSAVSELCQRDVRVRFPGAGRVQRQRHL